VAAQSDAEAVDVRVVKALGHATRVRILGVLRDRELASPVELSAELGIPLGTVGYHVRRLEDLGFIELAKRTQRRGAVEHHYRAREVLDGVGGDAAGAAEAPAHGLGAEAAAIARAAESAVARGGFDAVTARADRRIVLLDATGRSQLQRALPRWEATAERIARASAGRLSSGEAPEPHRCAVVLMRFDVGD
jgi:DNA-binding transcriptional ArsR family regulator